MPFTAWSIIVVVFMIMNMFWQKRDACAYIVKTGHFPIEVHSHQLRFPFLAFIFQLLIFFISSERNEGCLCSDYGYISVQRSVMYSLIMNYDYHCMIPCIQLLLFSVSDTQWPVANEYEKVNFRSLELTLDLKTWRNNL